MFFKKTVFFLMGLFLTTMSHTNRINKQFAHRHNQDWLEEKLNARRTVAETYWKQQLVVCHDAAQDYWKHKTKLTPASPHKQS